MVDDSVQREIEENNERHDADQERDTGLPGLLDDAVSPITDAIGRDDDDEETMDDQAAANDADQRA